MLQLTLSLANLFIPEYLLYPVALTICLIFLIHRRCFTLCPADAFRFLVTIFKNLSFFPISLGNCSVRCLSPTFSCLITFKGLLVVVVCRPIIRKFLLFRFYHLILGFSMSCVYRLMFQGLSWYPVVLHTSCEIFPLFSVQFCLICYRSNI